LPIWAFLPEIVSVKLWKWEPAAIFGISIAVGAVVAHGWFSRRIELMTSRMESVLADLSHLFGKSRAND